MVNPLEECVAASPRMTNPAVIRASLRTWPAKRDPSGAVGDIECGSTIAWGGRPPRGEKPLTEGSTNFALQPKVSQRVVSNERLRDRLRRHVERTHSRLDSRLAAI